MRRLSLILALALTALTTAANRRALADTARPGEGRIVVAEDRAGAGPGVGPAGGPAALPRASDPANLGFVPGSQAQPDPGPPPAPPVAPQTGGGEAQPAPGATTVATDGEQRLPPRGRFAVMPRFAYRLGGAGRSVTPAPGFGVGGTIEISYARRALGGQGTPGTPDAGPVLEAALGIDFSHDRFATSEQGSVTIEGMVETFASTRVVSETSFVLVHTAAARLGRVRPYFTIGAGLGLGYFDSAESDLRPGTARDTHLLGRAAIGVDVAVAPSWTVGARADYTAVRGTTPLMTAAGRSLPIFGDLLDVGAGVAYRF